MPQGYNKRTHCGIKRRISSLYAAFEENCLAKLEKTLLGDIEHIALTIQQGILKGSISATLEDSSRFYGTDGSRCIVMVFERYSWLGGNRLSLGVTLFSQSGGPVMLSAIASGGSQALFVKFNTFGEEAFLSKLEEILSYM